MIKCLITQPNYDKVTSYLFHFGKEILKENYQEKIQFMNLEGNQVNKINTESYLKKQNLKIVLFNGHGDDWTICGYKDESLIIMNENEELLKDKIVYSLSCSSAAKLGKNAIIKGTKTFIGYSADESFKKSKEEFRKETKKYLTGNLFEGSERIAMALLWNMDNQVVLGDKSARVDEFKLS